MNIDAEFLNTINKNELSLINFRRELHQSPELSFKEFKTTEKIFKFLKDKGLNPTLFKETTGLFVDIHSEGGENLPLILIRGDIDALPIQDLKTVEYHSKNVGVMHACGHDVHTTAVIGVLLSLNSVRQSEKFNVRAIFQPAEELGTGAEALVRQGVLLGVKYALSLHVDPFVPFGKVAIREGAINAAIIEFEITLKGKSSHVARVHLGIDTIGPACQLVSSCYSHIPKKIDARDPSLLYFGKFVGGNASNIVCEETTLLGTIRTFKSEVAETIYEEIRKIGKSIADATGVEFLINQKVKLKAVINDKYVAQHMADAAKEIVTSDNLITDLPTGMGGDDFGAIMSLVPGAMMRLGIKNDIGVTHGLHTPEFDVPEPVIALGSKILTNAIFKITSKE